MTPQRQWSLLLVLLLLSGGTLNSQNRNGIRPVIVKGRGVEFANLYAVDRWNSFSRIAVYPEVFAQPQYWGASPVAPKQPVLQRSLNIDGEAGTTMRRFHSPPDIEHLRYDLTSLAYWLGARAMPASSA